MWPGILMIWFGPILYDSKEPSLRLGIGQYGHSPYQLFIICHLRKYVVEDPQRDEDQPHNAHEYRKEGRKYINMKGGDRTDES